MERRIAGIIKWLERCLAAYRAGAVESALMDAECARADLDRLRDEVWNAVEKKHAPGARDRSAAVLVKAAGLALIAVLFSATPVAFLQEGRPHPEPVASLEWVTPDEKMLLGNLRRHLSESNSLAALPEQKEHEKTATTRALPVPGRTAHNAAATPVAQHDSNEADVPYDRIITLVQAGEKALKNERPVIRIERN